MVLHVIAMRTSVSGPWDGLLVMAGILCSVPGLNLAVLACGTASHLKGFDISGPGLFVRLARDGMEVYPQHHAAICAVLILPGIIVALPVCCGSCISGPWVFLWQIWQWLEFYPQLQARTWQCQHVDRCGIASHCWKS